MNLSPAAWRRIVPFAVFMLLLAVRGALPADGALDPRWLYTLTVVVVGALLLWWWRDYGELSRANAPTVGEGLLSVVVGLVVFALWITLDAPWMRLGEASASFDGRGPDGRPDWSLIVPRWIGAALLVPVMEELFWRSFLMRWIAKPQFEAVPPAQVGVKAIVLSTFVFMLAHTLWLAAIVAGLAYALLYVRTGKLWTAVIAHAVTNGVLGAWVVATNRWEFW
ncbi:CAAX prenyl protease-related protein [Aquabacterium sp. J223]|uniref:CAAX prenyl protease-related protein n=1 Tax=Aquabacterium sp. J223 TaxID=2898431 RepID=UPI0021AD9144|nr:CAAX prenyl protease-related protein [Aquabacterium sp. J223]UUX96113.1 CAAX prenyl protease-related protein [Aquabacterium sp. J223]